MSTTKEKPPKLIGGSVIEYQTFKQVPILGKKKKSQSSKFGDGED